LFVIIILYELFLGVDEYKAKRDTIKEKLKKKLNQETLNTTQLKLASDYYNDTEMNVKFKKVKVISFNNFSINSVIIFIIFQFFIRKKN